MPTRLHVLRVYRSAVAIIVVNARIVVPAVIVATVIPLVIELFVEHELPRGIAALVTTVVDSFAAMFFAGAAEQLVHRWEDGERRVELKGILSRVPPVILPLFAVAILQALAVGLGMLLLIIPGFIIWTFTAVVGPVVVAEEVGVRRSFRRSARLVRGNAWRVFFIVFSVELLAGILAVLIGLVFTSIGESSENPIALAIGEAFTFPLEVFSVAVMYWRLREIERVRLSAQADEAVAAG
ncbi:MAG TPA: hypothetical protein VH231_02855 [Solirubrobacteraceae bacterium]|nr:hypothetical protein [Solirubrobacteraceae bacterium]